MSNLIFIKNNKIFILKYKISKEIKYLDKNYKIHSETVLKSAKILIKSR